MEGRTRSIRCVNTLDTIFRYIELSLWCFDVSKFRYDISIYRNSPYDNSIYRKFRYDISIYRHFPYDINTLWRAIKRPRFCKDRRHIPSRSHDISNFDIPQPDISKPDILIYRAPIYGNFRYDPTQTHILPIAHTPCRASKGPHSCTCLLYTSDAADE